MNMKKLDFLTKRAVRFGYAIVPIVAALLCVTFLFSCKDDEPEEPNLSVSPSAEVISFAADGSTTDAVEFTVTTNQEGWQVKTDKAWCVVNKTGKGFTVSAVPNPTITAPADATITVSAGSAKPVTIKAQQAAAAVALAITPPVTTLAFAADGTTANATEFTVATNVASWDVTSSQAWCTVAKTSDGFSVTAAPNTTPTAPPDATITVSAEGANSIIITASQAAAGVVFSVSPSVSSIAFAADGSTTNATEFTVTTNLASWDVTSDQTWCTVTKSGNGFTVSAAPNTELTAPANATITVSAEGANSIIITASQAAVGVELSISPEKSGITFRADGGTDDPVTFTVETNVTPWNAVSDQSWCTVNATGTGDGDSFTLSAESYSGTSPRYATVTVSVEGTTLVISVTQEGLSSVIDLARSERPAGQGWTYADNEFTIADGANVTLTGSTTENRVLVASGATASVTLDNATIVRTSMYCFHMNGATVTLTLTGANSLTGGVDYAGIGVGATGHLTIGGSGSLTATGGGTGIAGIGGDRSNAPNGTVIINSGTVTARGGGGGGAGIGGAYGGHGGVITINGGTVHAVAGTDISGNWGAGIGGGRSGQGGIVTIAGGTVTAEGISAISGGRYLSAIEYITFSVTAPSYTYWTNSAQADPGGSGIDYPGGAAFTNPTAGYRYIKIVCQ
jgi:Tfp pilus assembly protein FimT